MKFIVKKYCLIISGNGNLLRQLQKNTAYEHSSVRKNKQNNLMLLSICAICSKKKSAFIKYQELHNFDDI